MNADTTRPHGVSNLVLAPDGCKLYALSTDSRYAPSSCSLMKLIAVYRAGLTLSLAHTSVVALDPLNLTHVAPLTTFASPVNHPGSFYIRCAVSPCSRFLASGTSSGDIVVWDTEGSGRAEDAVRLRGHEIEVGQVDWGSDSVSSQASSPPRPASLG